MKQTRILLTAAALALVLPLTALAHGPTRQKVTETITIDAPPEQVWQHISDFSTVEDLLPMVESTEMESGEPTEPGAIRVLTLKGGGQVREELKKYQPEKMSFSYRIPLKDHDMSTLPVSNYSSTLSVSPDGDGSKVTWKGAFYRGYMNNNPPPELNDEAAVEAVTGLYKAGLEHLKQVAESDN